MDFSVDVPSTKVDKLGRMHVRYSRKGLVIVFNRNVQFHTQTMEAHANDSLPLLSAAVQRGCMCIVCAVKNGSDMNLTMQMNFI